MDAKSIKQDCNRLLLAAGYRPLRRLPQERIRCAAQQIGFTGWCHSYPYSPHAVPLIPANALAAMDANLFGGLADRRIVCAGVERVIIDNRDVLTVCIPLLAFFCFIDIVPVKRFKFIRNCFSGRYHKLEEGVHWVFPWMETVVLNLPVNGRMCNFSVFQSNRFRYDPPPYRALTSDQVDVFVDLSLTYDIDLPAAIDYPVDFRDNLDDAARTATQQLVSQIARKDISASALNDKFRAKKWTLIAGCMVIDNVTVQNVRFDDQMQAILRAQSAGLDNTSAVDYLQGMNMATAVEHNQNAGVLVRERRHSRKQ